MLLLYVCLLHKYSIEITCETTLANKYVTLYSLLEHLLLMDRQTRMFYRDELMERTGACMLIVLNLVKACSVARVIVKWQFPDRYIIHCITTIIRAVIVIVTCILSIPWFNLVTWSFTNLAELQSLLFHVVLMLLIPTIQTWSQQGYRSR